MEYATYLGTKHWKKTREKKLNNRSLCQVCRTDKNLAVHHKRYKDKNNQTILFKEKNTNLITLCVSCHRLMHHYFGIEVRKINKKILHIQCLMKYGVKRDKAFMIEHYGLWWQIYEKAKKYNKENGLPIIEYQNLKEWVKDQKAPL